MPAKEQAAFNAGIEAMREMAIIAAVTIETRGNAREIRQQAAAALHGLAEEATSLLLDRDPTALADPLRGATDMQDLRKRLAKLEVASMLPSPPRQVRRFVIEAPAGTTVEEATAFLRTCSHGVRDADFNIIRRVIGAENGRPVDLPLRDRTHRAGA